MVHRPSDSRLLTNLLTCEKDYTKALSNVLSCSPSSLGALSAYASSFPTGGRSSISVAEAILTTTQCLAGADDALRLYRDAIEHWREEMKALRVLEEEVGRIGRDREIFVGRLIRASKGGSGWNLPMGRDRDRDRDRDSVQFASSSDISSVNSGGMSLPFEWFLLKTNPPNRRSPLDSNLCETQCGPG